MSPLPDLAHAPPAASARCRGLFRRLFCLTLALPGLGDSGQPALAVDGIGAAPLAGQSVTQDAVSVVPPAVSGMPEQPPPSPATRAVSRKDSAPGPARRPETLATPLFQRSDSAPSASLLRQGYAKLLRDELASARQDYEQAIQHDPNNCDALLALAAIAERRGQSAEADAFRQRALIAAPDDPAVLAASLGVAGSDPQTTESRLKILLARQADSPPLNFALGNLYARQNRWSEAQPLYLRAVAGEGDNPDYQYNLALSLDHLHQPQVAARHYRRALATAETRPPAFDAQQVGRRLAELGL
ncbi:MAG: tetratricopeptide repeat protein [Bacteroidota bacterium]